MSYTFLVTAPSLAEAGVRLLAQRGCTVLYIDDFHDQPALARCLASRPIDAVISRSMAIDEAMIKSAPQLKVIAKHGVGVSNIDVDAARRHGVAVYSTPGANSVAVAEYTLGLMLAAARCIARFDRAVRGGQWYRRGDGVQLAGRTLGLVGFGQIGQRVARYAQALEMQVLAYDPALTSSAAELANVGRASTLESLLAHAEILSLHCPARPGAPALLDRAALARLPPGAVVINTARGALIDEPALVEALREGRIASAGLDTFASEPLDPGSPLLTLENLVVSPHIAGSTPQALAAMAERAVTQALDHLDRLATLHPQTEGRTIP